MKYTVVVADDEEEIRRSLVRRVKWEEIGFEVVGEAENGADALELVEKLEPDLLLTDIKMPFLSGIELARAVREVRPMVQIAFLSGFDDFTYAQQAIQYNIVSYMAIGECGVEVLQKKYSMQQMREMERMAENFQIIKMLCMEAKKMLMDQRKKSSEVICEQAVQIIQDRYAQQDLSVMIISEEIGVSPNYLSSLIKKTTGSSMVEILTKKRIEKAMELLQCTGMKIGEITELCGYKDQYYFSHCFKKLTGVSPNKYRREHEQA